MAEVAISLPFAVDAYGKVNTTIDQAKIWADRVRSVIGTALRERVMQPLVGTEIPFTVFETTEAAESIIETTVQHAFEEQLPLLRLQEVSTTTDESLSAVNVSIIYALPNQEQVTTTLALVSIVGNTPIIEETQ
jgi:phage baseplate assembly protein W